MEKEKQSTVNQRFIEVCQELARKENLKTDSAIAERIRLNKQSYSDIKNNNRPVNLDHIMKLLAVYPVSVDYILGNRQGSAGKNYSVNLPKTFNTRYHAKLKHTNSIVGEAVDFLYNQVPGAVPYYAIDATASNMLVFNDMPEHPDSWIKIPGFADCEAAIPVIGDSMHPVFKPGDIIMLKKASQETILWGHAYLVVTQDIRTLKYLRKNQNEDLIICEPANQAYDSFVLDRKKIKEMFIVVGSIQRIAF